MKKVLLVYGTRYGSTEEISNKIKEVLQKNDIDVDLINLEDRKLKNLPSLEEFDGIMIGSSIKIGKMTKNVRKFLKKYADKLKNKTNLIGVFVSCGSAGDPAERPKARKEYIESVLEKYGIDADMYEAFGGVLDLTEDSNLGFVSKKMMAAAAKDDESLTAGEKNDTRDWEFISSYAKSFCDSLNK